MKINMNIKGIERSLEKNKDQIDAILRAHLKGSNKIKRNAKKEFGGDKMRNKYTQRYIGELLNKRKSSEGQLEEADRWLDHWQKSKEAHEKNIDEIDEALITLGYKGEESE